MTTTAPSRLARRLRTADAVFIGLGSMVGAGIFAAIGPAIAAAGSAVLLALVLAALVAGCNAASVARLAPLHPESGGAYAYGRARLGPAWGFVAGWAFLCGKLASCAAMALTVGNYALPDHARAVAIAAIATVTAINLRGVDKTATVTRWLVIAVLGALGCIVVAAFGGGAASVARLRDAGTAAGPADLLRSAALLFFAFAGYARVATLGEEVIDPARTIPRAIGLALALALLLYGIVLVATLATVPVREIAAARAPLVAVAASGALSFLAPAARIGASVASLGVLLSLLAGVSRTAFAMAANGDLPSSLAAVHPATRVPHRAELVAGALVAAIVALADVRAAIGFSAFTILVYYAIANAAALTVPAQRRAAASIAPLLGIAGCAALAFSLPISSIAIGLLLVASGVVVRVLRGPRSPV